jgi:excisionase family DNA binding protein
LIRRFDRGILAMDDANLKITDKEIVAAFLIGGWAEQFPPVLTVDQAAELAQVPKATIYSWSSSGALDGCGRKVGKHLRIYRDRFLKRLFNEGINGET